MHSPAYTFKGWASFVNTQSLLILCNGCEEASHLIVIFFVDTLERGSCFLVVTQRVKYMEDSRHNKSHVP